MKIMIKTTTLSLKELQFSSGHYSGSSKQHKVNLNFKTLISVSFRVYIKYQFLCLYWVIEYTAPS